MKAKLKRINRGVVLSIVTVIVFIICTMVSTSSFKKRETAQIKSVVESYTEQLALCSVNTNGASDFADQSSQEARKIIAGYWEDSEYLDNYNNQMFSEYYYELKSDMIRDIGYADDYFTSMDYITSVTSTVSIDSVRKNGANGATVQFSVIYKVCGEGTPGLYTIAGLYPIYEPLSTDTPATYSAYNVTAQLYKEDGQWKIVGIDWWGLDSDTMYEYY